MRALVTGGAGFIGSHLVDALLARGDEVVVVDDLSSGRREHLAEAATLVEHDIRRPFTTRRRARLPPGGTDRRRDVDGPPVVRRGGQRRRHRQRARGGPGGRRAGRLRLDRRRDLRRRATSPRPRTRRSCPSPPYGLAKLAAELYLDGWNRIYGSAHVVLRFAQRLRPAPVGGARGRRRSRSSSSGSPRGEPTTIFGDGTNTRDFVHVDDVVRALLLAVGAAAASSTSGRGSRPPSPSSTACASRRSASMRRPSTGRPARETPPERARHVAGRRGAGLHRRGRPRPRDRRDARRHRKE